MKPINLSDKMTITELAAVAEIWYSRLNVLKAWLGEHSWHPKFPKLCGVCAELAIRLTAIAEIHRRHYANVSAKSLNKYPSGSAPVFESGPEVVEWPKVTTHAQHVANMEEIKRIIEG